MSLGCLNRWTSWILVVLGVLGCANHRTPNAIENADLLQEVECLAIFPLADSSKSGASSPVFETLLYNELMASKKFSAVEAQEVTAAIKKSPLRLYLSPNQEQLKQYGELLQVQGILVGAIQEYGYQSPPHSGEQVPSLSYQLAMYHIPSATLIWSYKSNHETRSFGPRNREPLSRIALISIQDALRPIIAKVQGRAAVEPLKKCGVGLNIESPSNP